MPPDAGGFLEGRFVPTPPLQPQAAVLTAAGDILLGAVTPPDASADGNSCGFETTDGTRYRAADVPGALLFLLEKRKRGHVDSLRAHGWAVSALFELDLTGERVVAVVGPVDLDSNLLDPDALPPECRSLDEDTWLALTLAGVPEILAQCPK